MPGTVNPNRFSRNIPMDVWSKTCEVTQPPLLQGDTTYIGTRALSPKGRTRPETVSSGTRYLPSWSRKYSPSSFSVALPASVPSGLYDGGAGGGT